MSKYSVKKPITVLMGILIIIVLGAFSVTRLPLSLFPDINLPFVVTVTSYVGASPETIESDVTLPIEAAVSTIGNFSEVSSQSNENFAISFVIFEDGTNLDSVTVELREIINNLEFPEDVGNTTILRLSPDLLPVMTVTMFRNFSEEVSDEEALILNTEWINRDIISELESIPGVASVSLTGAADVVLEVDLNNDALNEYGVSEAAVVEIINEQNEDGLVGAAIDEGTIRLLYVAAAPSSLDDVNALPILYANEEVVTLAMLSDSIGYANQAVDSYSKVNGEQGIQIQFQKQSDVGITEVTSRILDTLDKLITSSDYDANYEVLLDQGEFITTSINSVFMNLIIGGVLAIGVLLLFLRDLKPTIIVGLAIPISVIAAFLLMFISNISLNIISMGGLALGIGMLVDNAVVVIENIYRMLSEGKSKVDAAIFGAKEVGGAIIASTMTTAAVFLPIFFIEGLVADIFIPMALTIVYSLGASLIIALTLVPSMSSRFLSSESVKQETKVMHTFKDWYKSSVLFAIHHKIIVTLTLFVLLIGASALVFTRGFILLPSTDEGTISVNVTFTGDVEFETKTAFADRLTTQFLAIEDVETVSATVGGGFVFGPPTAQGSGDALSMTINLRDNRSQSTDDNKILIENNIINFNYDNISNLTSDQVIEAAVSTQNSSAGAFGATGISATIKGFDLLTLEAIANDLVDIMRDIDGVENPDNGIAVGADRVLITVNKEEAIKYGLTNADVIRNIETAFDFLGDLQGGQPTQILLDGNLYDLNVPTEAVSNLTLDVFGDYTQFLGGVHLFDDEILDFIEVNYNPDAFGPLYVPNIFLPTYVQGDPVQFIVNPAIFVTVDENNFPTAIVNPGMDSLPLTALAAASLGDSEQTVVNIEKVTGFATIFTDGTSRYLEVTADVEDGYNVTLVSGEVIDAVNTYLDGDVFASYGGGYSVSFSGENEEINDLFTDLALGLLVAILIVYMVMAIQFQSLKYPLIILGTIPLAFTGGMLALLVTGNNLSLVALVGFVILVGIVVNNGIVLIDYINQLRERGKGVLESIVEAGQTRLRPIFMTALTTVLALLILALGIGEGSELLQPLAITAIGGLLYATILTLLVIPMIYALFNRKQVNIEESK
ncbi:MAG: efflux RND transporter permease subunit [Acholeplasmataceae bacterium]